MVHLFDELVKTIPASVRLTSMKQNADSMVLYGVAQSNASVAEYMRNLDGSPWMGNADLDKTQIQYRTGRMPYTFGLRVKLSQPNAEEPGKTPVLPGDSPAGSSAAAVSGGARK
jgi:type IV pilus assembly protein PilN